MAGSMIWDYPGEAMTWDYGMSAGRRSILPEISADAKPFGASGRGLLDHRDEWLSFRMFGEFPLGPQWAAELFAAVLPPSAFEKIHVGHRDAVASQLVRTVMARSGDLASIIERVHVASRLLDRAFNEAPEVLARVVDSTFQRLGELQQRESSFAHDTERARKDDPEARFGSFLDLYEFTSEQYYRTLAAPYVAGDAITRTGEVVADLTDVDGRVKAERMTALEAGQGIRPGVITEGLDRHLRNSAAHHRYSILSDDRLRLWDMDRAGTYTWGPVEWTFWECRTRVFQLSNTCSVLLLGLAAFEIANGATIRAREWGLKEERPRPRRRDIAKAELNGMADLHGFIVENVTLEGDHTLVIALRVKGDTIIEQTTQILAGGVGGTRGRYAQRVRTVWGPLRNQVYGFLQTTFDVHGGYDLVRVNVVARDGKTGLGTVGALLGERLALIDGKEPTEAIRARLLDTLADEKIPIVIKDPLVPVV